MQTRTLNSVASHQSTDAARSTCPNCSGAGLNVFYTQERIPVNSAALYQTREASLSAPTGQIVLGLCERCGFITNLHYDPYLYRQAENAPSARRITTHIFDDLSDNFARDLALRHAMQGKNIIEIGCGQGEFLDALCKLSGAAGTGFDPDYRPGQGTRNLKLNYIKDLYSEKYAEHKADFVICKLTLEHITETTDFMRTVRRAIGKQKDTIAIFLVPNGEQILRNVAFQDITYEHCSYFTKESLAYLFRSCAFEVLTVEAYEDDYLLIEAKPISKPDSTPPKAEERIAIRDRVGDFAKHSRGMIGHWQNKLVEFQAEKKRVVVWGTDSSAITFMATVPAARQIEFVVDEDPRKMNLHIPNGQRIVAPDFLQMYQPDAVIVINPLDYMHIQSMLNKLSVPAELLPL